VLTLSETIIKKGRNPYLSSNLTDWDSFRETVVNRINLRVALTANDELEYEAQKFVTDIQHSAWEATPLVTKKVKVNTYLQEVREKNCRKTQNQEKVANDSKPWN
jgi:hypothetical protein